MSDEPTVDPRYAAQFQRGYDGPVLAPPHSAPADSTRSSPVRISGGPPSTAARVPDPPSLVAPAPADEEAVDVDDEPEAPATSWIEWLLPAVGALLLAVAVLLFWQSVTDTSAYLGTNSPGEQVFADVRGTLPGPLFVAAFVAGSIGVMLRAVRPRR
jgi:hypothetical protein